MFTRGKEVEFVHYSGRISKGLVDEDREIDSLVYDFLGAQRKGFGRFVILSGERRKELPLFYKSTEYADDYIAKYRVLKSLGFPVPATMRKVDDRWGYVVMTDYSAKGAIFFGKAMGLAMGDYSYSEPEAKNYVDEIPEYALRGIMDAHKHLGDIDVTLKRYEQMATVHGIRLPSDEVYEIVVFPNVKWKLMLLDLGDVRLGFDKGVASRFNRSCGDSTIQNINYIYEWLLTRGRVPFGER